MMFCTTFAKLEKVIESFWVKKSYIDKWLIISCYTAVQYCTVTGLINHLHVTPITGKQYFSILCTQKPKGLVCEVTKSHTVYSRGYEARLVANVTGKENQQQLQSLLITSIKIITLQKRQFLSETHRIVHTEK
jgi:hypothetical protein